ncbi:GNAT family N-acetyltransferase [Kitasatospora sp. GAS1066B]|uniref:GNAT family N-acetyltransferase n=1 Tax=Kitasatospora sp. GAS1066B TaxID=3156271 RepID=UPI003511F79B
MRLRDVELADLPAYLRMRCDPVMMAGLGGPLPADGMPDKVGRDVERVLADDQWIKMIVLGGGHMGGGGHGGHGGDGGGGGDGAATGVVAGTVTLWTHEYEAAGAPYSEIGWMVLPEFQGQGLAKCAVRELLRLARADGRWGLVSAFPATTNAASNGICRSLGFTFQGERRTEFAGRSLSTNHWTIAT